MQGKNTVSVASISLIFLLSSAAHAERIPSGATAFTAEYRGKSLVQATLLVDVVKAAPGVPFTAGVHFKMAPGWRIYWRNPGDTGLPTRLNWSTSGKGVTIGEAAWPTPMVKRDASGQITTYEYGGQTLIAAPIMAKVRRGRPGISLTVKVKLLACNKVCVPGDLTLTRTVPVAEEVERLPREQRWTFERFRGHVPKVLGQLGYSQRWTRLPSDTGDDERVRLQVEIVCKGSGPCPGIRAPAWENPRDAFMLMSGEMESVKVERIQMVRGGQGLIMILSAGVEPELKKKDLALGGVLAISDQHGQPLFLEMGGTARRFKDDTDR